uniref:T-complex protein 1 subunit eta n=1 Tax=Timspurckia oligopyrenoides TaxID=708627 RepID=A0A6T6L5U2_9RHOD|mmetsp:Transcript_12085/g.21863  ORF Transcript_12085/g.21863 Transcript_12085/m.21863 type:complete len:575 (+) Transcript_12085:85-1809(+)|eukprot:CAMPEP_0182446572 /NCGR_PEP_ID=MMETSP1172-20130603/4287_1 /TAXON_ID=708627 /ORGANISM="Timspurckia oligopyrenoides, Strain CCMP3278" /LENGTH=574 /DNA_ID=CAMNT_0024642523 /DNA_START=15 /DNA_END=1742 /DNA_ORIENTATION=+
MSQFLAPQIVFLKNGTDTSQGKGQLISNMNACQAIGEILRTTLGPRGMDKLIHEGRSVTISNDGATIVKLLNIVHPAAKTLVDIAKSQDDEVGDGTTSVTLLACEFMKNSRDFIEEGMHPRVLIKAYRTACTLALARIRELAVDIRGKDEEEHRTMLQKCAATALNSKLISHHKEFFSKMVTDAVLSLDEDLDIGMIGIKKVAGGSVMDSLLVDGVAFKKTFSYAGFEQQPKKFTNPKIILLNVELELKAEKENAEVRVNSTSEYQAIVDAEWNIIYNKLEKIVDTGAKVVLSRLAIGDLATQYFADRDIFCAGRVPSDDMERVSRAVGGAVQTSVNNVPDTVLGSCALFEERSFGNERFNLFTGCPSAKTATIIVRGGSEQFMEETERSLHDSIMIARRAIKYPTAVAGGGAIEMELSRYLRDEARKVHGKHQLAIAAFAKSLEIIPRCLCDNAGFDSTNVLNKLRAKHAVDDESGRWIGVDIDSGDVCNTWESFVWEPALVKLNAIAAATEACCLILSTDETIRNPQSEAAAGGAPGGGGGMPMGGMGGMGMAGMPGMGGPGVRKLGGRGGH